MCAGCGAPVVVRHVLKALNADEDAVICSATGCLEVCTFIFPYTSWKDSFIHSAFENSAATLSGVEAAYRNLRRKNAVREGVKFIVFSGDVGSYDIGLQSMSGMFERGHKIVYVCYDNGAYMNTGVQRSSATPRFTDTTTTPASAGSPGKRQPVKDMVAIAAAHGIAYAAQTAAVGNMKDLYEKADKALKADGPAYLNILAPCPRGWRYDTPDLMKINKLAVDTNFWPLYEIREGVLRINFKPQNRKPIEDFLKPQARFRHLFEEGNRQYLQTIQEEVDRRWDKLNRMEGPL